jgi:hypothetical protein
MVVLPFTGASRYDNCCTDDGTSPEYFGNHLVLHAGSLALWTLFIVSCSAMSLASVTKRKTQGRQFWGAFALAANIIYWIRYVCPSVPMNELRVHWTDSREISHRRSGADPGFMGPGAYKIIGALLKKNRVNYE